MTPNEFIAKWRASELKERSASQEHFIDLCRLLDEPTPAEADPTGETYCFERGARRDAGRDGWADVWKRHHFAWEYKGKRANLDAAFDQLRQYALALENPPLLIVSDMARFRIRTNWTNSVSRTHEFELDDLADAATRDRLKWAFSDPKRLRPGETRQTLTERVASSFAAVAQALRERGHDPQTVAHFVNCLVFCMFADDAKRAKQLPDVYQFKTLPQPLRVQIQCIIRDAFTLWEGVDADPRLYETLHDALAREYGLPVLAAGRYPVDRVYAFLAEADIRHVMDAIEVALQLAYASPGRDPSAGMNSAGQDRVIGERQTAAEFDKPEYRFLVVANKFQTGFDQPLLHTMYVDKKLGGVNAVQTLSRLNRTHPGKQGTMVLDFANEADEIQKAFEPYFETTLLSEETDPNLLYEVQGRLLDFGVFAAADIEKFARAYFDPRATQDRLYKALEPARQRSDGLADDEGHDFRGQLDDYVRLYAFLSQVLTFADPDLEKLYVFARHLRRLLPGGSEKLPIEVQQNIDMESFRIQRTSRGRIGLERQPRSLEPAGSKPGRGAAAEELEQLSRIIEALNERFGLNLGREHRLTLEHLRSALDDDAGLDASARANTRENVRLTFDPKVEDRIQEIVETNFDLYKRITDDPEFGRALKNFLFDDYIQRHRRAEELLKLQESKTLEFKSSLRWNLKEDRKDDRHVTHAALKTIAAFLNTEGGDLLIGVDDDRTVLGIDHDRLENDDRFLRHLAQAVRNGLGDRAGTCIDPGTQIVEGRTVCLVSCQRSPEPVHLRWKGLERAAKGDLYVRSGPGTVRLGEADIEQYVATRFGSQMSGSE